MRANSLLMLVAVVSVGAEVSCQKTTKRCDQIPLGKANYQNWIRFSPFYFYRSLLNIFDCTTVQLVGPTGTNTNYSGTTTVLNGNKAIVYQETLVNNSVLNAHACADGTPVVQLVLTSKIRSRNNAWYCLFACDSEGVNITTLDCVGRTPNDEAEIQNYLETNLNVPITGTLYRSQSNCPKPKHCVANS